ncbi:MAG TPA: malto-oligosyltrehalose synthase [Ilumatobacter sp.]|nr:malto-oligosyltrehalose synthase [Ilumatobacter sp.]
MAPRVTYRVQFHPGFTFEDAAAVVPYLEALGVSHLYCSPYLQAAPGSTHGYDVVDPRTLNHELGGAPGHAHLTGVLRAAGMGQVLDIVPNHMAVDATNRWWWDVLENGPSSRHARVFDIDWEGGDGKSTTTVLVPILGDQYGRVLEAGDLRLERLGAAFRLRYHEHVLPLAPRSLEDVLGPAARRCGSAELATSADGFGALPHAARTDARAVRERRTRIDELVQELSSLCEASSVAEAIDAELEAIHADPDRLDDLLQRQNYRIAHWRTASEELDYRRFFNIDTLVGVRVEEPEVFDATHELILALVRDGTVDGLRIDHVDGLRDPEHYLRELADATDGCWTVVEKILEPAESLPASWPVAGTSGYDFLIRVNNLFVESANEAAMTECYAAFAGERLVYDDVVHVAKHQIMAVELAAEVDRLTGILAGVCDGHRRHRDHTRRELRDALREYVAAFPVYRSYVTTTRAADGADRAHIAAAVAGARERRPDVDGELLTFIGQLATGDVPGDGEHDFAVRLQQLTAPVTAKGVEDTAFYRYHRLISLNEVGGDPSVFGSTAADFHRATVTTVERWPTTMLALSTHDTKRSADVRARLNVLSEMPVPWSEAVRRWAELNERHRHDGWPDRNTEYLLYQTAIGAWPIDVERLVGFMAKATRESKTHTSWMDPVTEYDEAVERFVRAIMSDHRFVSDVEIFLAEHRLVERGRRNSLAQTALLLTCPGVPDVYQGSELWDLSLVDPDNRRPVDHELRRRLLDELPNRPPGLLATDDVGVEKLRLIHRVLDHRRARPDAFDASRYEPLDAGDGVVAFSRGELAVVARTRTGAHTDGAVELPAGAWVDLLTGGRVDGGRQDLQTVLGGLPVSVLAQEGS